MCLPFYRDIKNIRNQYEQGKAKKYAGNMAAHVRRKCILLVIIRPSCDILPERRHPRPADPGYAAVPLMQSRLLP